MTIAIDARIINSSTGRYVERLIHYLEELDKKHDYVILVQKKDLDFYRPTNPRFRIVEADFDNYSLVEQIGFKRLLDRVRPDLVHFCMPQQPVLYRGRHVTTVHDLNLLQTYNSDKNYFVFHFKQLVGRLVFQWVGHNSAHIITPTNYVRDAYSAFAGINPDKVTVTLEGAERGEVTPLPYKSLQNKKYIMYLGSESDYKNIRRLMQAHQLLLRRHPSLLLVLVGRLSGKNGAAAARNKAWAEKNGLANIIFTDFVPDTQTTWLYRHTEGYVFPSLMEGFGLPALEAMHEGAAVISSNATCLPEVYGDAAEYFDPTDIHDMAAAIERVITDPKRQKELQRLGKAKAATYSWRRMAEQTLAVYNQVLAEG